MASTRPRHHRLREEALKLLIVQRRSPLLHVDCGVRRSASRSGCSLKESALYHDHRRARRGGSSLEDNAPHHDHGRAAHLACHASPLPRRRRLGFGKLSLRAASLRLCASRSNRMRLSRRLCGASTLRATRSLATAACDHSWVSGIRVLVLNLDYRETSRTPCCPVYFRARCACAWPIVRTLAVPPLRRAHRRDHREPRHDARPGASQGRRA